MSSSETESTASDMSDLSDGQDLGEVGEGGEVDKAPCNTVENVIFNQSINNSDCRIDLDRFEASKWTLR
jgi:hypothetical protein